MLEEGDICYQKLRGLDAPCADCPLRSLKEGQENVVKELRYAHGSRGNCWRL